MPLRRYRRSHDAEPDVSCGACPALGCATCQAVKSAGADALAAFASVTRRRFVRPGEQIFRAGDDDEGLSVVAQGLVMTQRILSDGRRQVIGFRYPGDVVNFPGVVDPRPLPVVIVPGVLCHVDAAAFGNFRRNFPHAAERLARLAGAEVARLAEHVLLLGRLTAAERTAAFLIEVATRLGRKGRDGTTVTLPMRRDDIADYLGVNAETVSRQFSWMKRRNLIALPKPNQVVIRDWDAMRAVAPFLPGPPALAQAGVAPVKAPVAA